MKLFLGFLIWFPAGVIVGVFLSVAMVTMKYVFKPKEIPK